MYILFEEYMYHSNCMLHILFEWYIIYTQMYMMHMYPLTDYPSTLHYPRCSRVVMIGEDARQ